MNILFLAGSFHAKSHTQALIRFLIACFADAHDATSWPIETLPFYDPDLSGERRPAPVTEFLDAVMRVDALVAVTPEYNHSVPAVLKNAIDWASRPAFKSPLRHKPVTCITQAGSPVGGARAQAHLKLIFDSTLSHLHPAHEMMVHNVEKLFDADLRLTDEDTARRLNRHMQDFIAYAAAMRQLAL